MLQRKKPLTRKTPLRAKKPLRAKTPMRTKSPRASADALSMATDTLWPLLSARAGPPFRRNERLGPAVADFYCPAARLAVLVTDGDDRRAALLDAAGYRVVTVAAAEAAGNPQALLDAVTEAFMLRLIPR